MQIDLINETSVLDDGTYSGIVKEIFTYQKGDGELCACIEISLQDDDLVFVNFVDDPVRRFGSYPWSSVFKALNTIETDDLIGKEIEFEIKNSYLHCSFCSKL